MDVFWDSKKWKVLLFKKKSINEFVDSPPVAQNENMTPFCAGAEALGRSKSCWVDGIVFSLPVVLAKVMAFQPIVSGHA